MRWVMGTDARGRAVRCPVCGKPVRVNQAVTIVDGKPTHERCARGSAGTRCLQSGQQLLRGLEGKVMEQDDDFLFVTC